MHINHGLNFKPCARESDRNKHSSRDYFQYAQAQKIIALLHNQVLVFEIWDLEGVLSLSFWDSEGVLGLSFSDSEGSQVSGLRS